MHSTKNSRLRCFLNEKFFKAIKKIRSSSAIAQNASMVKEKVDIFQIIEADIVKNIILDWNKNIPIGGSSTATANRI